jgi:uncharacterized protein
VNPINVDASAIREAVGTSVDVSAPVELNKVDVSGVVYAPREPGVLDATLTNSGEGLVLHGTITALFDVECSRCLAPFGFEVSTDVDTLFVDETAEREDDEQDVVAFVGDQIDLAPVIESALRVEMPLAPSCKEECEGICPDCGIDLNEDSCDCADRPDEDGPFAGLKDMLEADDSAE